MKKLLLLTILPFIVSCQNSNYKYSEDDTKQFLNEITKNAKVSITDITEIEKKPTDEFGIITKYPLSKKELVEYHKNEGTLINKDDDISDFTTYTFKNYELINEKNEKLIFVDKGRAVYLQEYALWEYNKILCQNLGIEINLNQKFEKLRGYIDIEFKMPNGMNKEIKIPVNISINDKAPE
jgi:hypothetical protein